MVNLEKFQQGRRRWFLLVGALLFFGLWFLLNLRTFTSTSDDRLRAVIGSVFALAIALRPKNQPFPERTSLWVILTCAIGGALVAVAGIVFRVRQFEWLGLILVVYSCLDWTFPESFSSDLKAAFFVLYWIHPLPNQLFGPLQVVLQRVSVSGSEWFLHSLNVRAWADGIYLRTGMRIFEVPEACSGMRTATTALLSCLGTGILFRLRVRHFAWLLPLGLLQVLFLNIVRISIMVSAAEGKPPDWSSEYLHDSSGLLLLAAIVLLQFETTLWDWWRRQSRQRRATLSHEITEAGLMHILYGVPFPRLSIAVRVSLTAAVVFLVMAAFYKKRPEHRAAMIADVVQGLMPGNVVSAEKAAREAVALQPEKSAYRQTLAQVMLLRGKYGEALTELDNIQLSERGEFHVILRCWALVGSGRMEEARTLLNTLPEDERRHPGIAMAAAEFAATEDHVEEVIRNLRFAVTAPALVERVRKLFPYLAAREQWKAIGELDVRSVPCTTPETLLIGLTASLIIGDTDRADSLLRNNQTLWNDNPVFARHLLAMALRRSPGYWRNVYADSVLRTLSVLSPDELCDRVDACLQLRRPDLAWRAYDRLRSLDPRHPGLLLLPVLYGDNWFTFFRSDLQLKSESPQETVDIRKSLGILDKFPQYMQGLTAVPLAEELNRPDVDAFLKASLKDSIASLERMAAGGSMPYSMGLLYVSALEKAGRIKDALGVLDTLAAQHRTRQAEIQIRQANLFSLEGQWQKSYEAIRTVYQPGLLASPSLSLAMIDTLMHLDLGLYALKAARDAASMFPESMEIRAALASVWEAFGYDEEALFVLFQQAETKLTETTARLLEKSGRFSEADRVRHVLGLPDVQNVANRMWIVPPAERAVTWHEMRMPTPEDADKIVGNLRQAITADTSPFVKEFHRLIMDWYSARGGGTTADPDMWENIGRDPLEKAVALHRLAMLEARKGSVKESLRIIARALKWIPDSNILWRMRAAMTAGDPGVVHQARVACPDDSEIWLAWLVVSVRDKDSAVDIDAEIRGATEKELFSPCTFVRAGDFLLRSGLQKAAGAASDYALSQSRDFLPPCVLGLKCALASRDTLRALKYALNCADLAPDPWPFHKAAAVLKMLGQMFDLDLIRRLEILYKEFPSEPEWGLRLAGCHFYRGEMTSAWKTFSDVLSRHETALDPGSLQMAAEAARRCGENAEAIRILRSARTRYPENVNLLNNLVFTLAQSRETLAEARTLVPKLLELDPIASSYDTISLVYHRAGDTEQAQFYLNKALESVKPEDPLHWNEIHLNAAEIQFDMGRFDQSRRILDELRRYAKGTALSDPRVAELTRKLETELGASAPAP